MCFLAGFINAVYANSFDDISIVPTFVLTPLIYLGGVFYSTQMLPPSGGLSVPQSDFYMVNTFRYGLRSSDVDVIGLSDSRVFAVSLYCGCLWLLRHGTGIRFRTVMLMSGNPLGESFRIRANMIPVSCIRFRAGLLGPYSILKRS